jgi:hypothetical protein
VLRFTPGPERWKSWSTPVSTTSTVYAPRSIFDVSGCHLSSTTVIAKSGPTIAWRNFCLAAPGLPTVNVPCSSG